MVNKKGGKSAKGGKSKPPLNKKPQQAVRPEQQAHQQTPQERVALVRPLWETLEQDERVRLLSVDLDSVRARAKQLAEAARKQAVADAPEGEPLDPALLELEPSIEDVLEEGIKRLKDKGTWKLWQWPADNAAMYDAESFRQHIAEKHIREELRRLLPRDEGRATEKPAESAFRQRMLDLLAKVQQSSSANSLRPTVTASSDDAASRPHRRRGDPGSHLRDANIELLALLLEALARENDHLYHSLLTPITTYVMEILPEGHRETSKLELSFEDLENLLPDDVTRIVEWLTEKVDSLSTKLKPEPKDDEEEEEENMGDVDLWALADEDASLTVNSRWLQHLQDRLLGEDGHPRRAKPGEDSNRNGLVLEWVYGSIVSTAEKARDGAKRCLGMQPPTALDAHMTLIRALEDHLSWESRAKQCKDLLSEMLKSRLESTELTKQGYDLRPQPTPPGQRGLPGADGAASLVSPLLLEDSGASLGGDSKPLPDEVILFMLRREALLTRAKLHWLVFEHLTQEKELRILKQQLRQGEPEFERLKRELDEVKHQPRMEGAYRNAAEMERHRHQVEVQTAFREQGARLQATYDKKQKAEYDMAKRETEIKQLQGWKGTVENLVEKFQELINSRNERLAAANSSADGPRDGGSLETDGDLEAAAGSLTPQQYIQLTKMRNHFIKDVRKQLYGDADDRLFFDNLKAALKAIEKRLEDSAVALQHLEMHLINVACDDPGALIGTQLALPLLQDRLDARGLEYAAQRAKEAEDEVLKMELLAVEREAAERERKKAAKAKKNEKVKSEKERLAAERQAKEEADRRAKEEAERERAVREEEERRKRLEAAEAQRIADDAAREQRRQELMKDPDGYWRQRVMMEQRLSGMGSVSADREGTSPASSVEAADGAERAGSSSPEDIRRGGEGEEGFVTDTRRRRHKDTRDQDEEVAPAAPAPSGPGARGNARSGSRDRMGPAPRERGEQAHAHQNHRERDREREPRRHHPSSHGSTHRSGSREVSSRQGGSQGGAEQQARRPPPAPAVASAQAAVPASASPPSRTEASAGAAAAPAPVAAAPTAAERATQQPSASAPAVASPAAQAPPAAAAASGASAAPAALPAPVPSTTPTPAGGVMYIGDFAIQAPSPAPAAASASSASATPALQSVARESPQAAPATGPAQAQAVPQRPSTSDKPEPSERAQAAPAPTAPVQAQQQQAQAQPQAGPSSAAHPPAQPVQPQPALPVVQPGQTVPHVGPVPHGSVPGPVHGMVPAAMAPMTGPAPAGQPGGPRPQGPMLGPQPPYMQGGMQPMPGMVPRPMSGQPHPPAPHPQPMFVAARPPGPPGTMPPMPPGAPQIVQLAPQQPQPGAAMVRPLAPGPMGQPVPMPGMPAAGPQGGLVAIPHPQGPPGQPPQQVIPAGAGPRSGHGPQGQPMAPMVAMQFPVPGHLHGPGVTLHAAGPHGGPMSHGPPPPPGYPFPHAMVPPGAVQLVQHPHGPMLVPSGLAVAAMPQMQMQGPPHQLPQQPPQPGGLQNPQGVSQGSQPPPPPKSPSAAAAGSRGGKPGSTLNATAAPFVPKSSAPAASGAGNASSSQQLGVPGPLPQQQGQRGGYQRQGSNGAPGSETSSSAPQGGPVPPGQQQGVYQRGGQGQQQASPYNSRRRDGPRGGAGQGGQGRKGPGAVPHAMVQQLPGDMPMGHPAPPHMYATMPHPVAMLVPQPWLVAPVPVPPPPVPQGPGGEQGNGNSSGPASAPGPLEQRASGNAGDSGKPSASSEPSSSGQPSGAPSAPPPPPAIPQPPALPMPPPGMALPGHGHPRQMLVPQQFMPGPMPHPMVHATAMPVSINPAAADAVGQKNGVAAELMRAPRTAQPSDATAASAEDGEGSRGGSDSAATASATAPTSTSNDDKAANAAAPQQDGSPSSSPNGEAGQAQRVPEAFGEAGGKDKPSAQEQEASTAVGQSGAASESRQQQAGGSSTSASGPVPAASSRPAPVAASAPAPAATPSPPSWSAVAARREATAAAGSSPSGYQQDAFPSLTPNGNPAGNGTDTAQPGSAGSSWKAKLQQNVSSVAAPAPSGMQAVTANGRSPTAAPNGVRGSSPRATMNGTLQLAASLSDSAMAHGGATAGVPQVPRPPGNRPSGAALLTGPPSQLVGSLVLSAAAPAEAAGAAAPAPAIVYHPGVGGKPRRLQMVRGLQNLGGQNNCFLNVALQSLWHLRSFRGAMLGMDVDAVAARGATSPDVAVLRSLVGIFRAMAAPATAAQAWAVSPAPLREALSGLQAGQAAVQLERGEMHDASEVLDVLLTCMHRAEAGSGAAQGQDPQLPRRLRLRPAAANGALANGHNAVAASPAPHSAGGYAAAVAGAKGKGGAGAATEAAVPSTAVHSLFGLEVQRPVTATADEDDASSNGSSGGGGKSRTRGDSSNGATPAAESAAPAARQGSTSSSGGGGTGRATTDDIEVEVFTKWHHLVHVPPLREAFAALGGTEGGAYFEDVLCAAEAAGAGNILRGGLTPAARRAAAAAAAGQGAANGHTPAGGWAPGATAAGHPLATLLRFPSVFTLALGWESAKATPDKLRPALEALGPRLDLALLFRCSGDAAPHSAPCELRSIICYGDHHYTVFALSEELGLWLLIDDANIQLVGDWGNVVKAMWAKRLQPSLLFYEAERQMPAA